MPVEQPAFERVRSLSEHKKFPTHCKLQYTHINFISCFLITVISGCISINLINIFEQVIDINKMNSKIITRFVFRHICFQFLKSTPQCDIFKILYLIFSQTPCISKNTVKDVAISLPITFIPVSYKISHISILRLQLEPFPDRVYGLVHCDALRAEFMYHTTVYL